MQSDYQDQFHARLSQWVAGQGFWFQLRHSIGTSGSRSNITYHLLRLTFRLLIFIAILAAGGFYYLIKRTDGDTFRTNLRESIAQSLGIDELAVSGAKRSQGSLEIRRFAGEGGTDTLFEFFEARNLSCQMGLLDGLTGQWNPGTITINRFDAQIRAGTNTPEDSANIGRLIFHDFEDVLIRNIEIKSARIGWGYSERTRGRIDDAKILLQRIDENWRIIVRGGEFSQNWLRGFEIVEIIAIASPQGISFEKADLKQKNGGSLDFSGTRITAGDRPKLNGTVKARSIAIDPLLPSAARDILEGTISSDFTLGGSTNTSDGISLAGMVYLDGINSITIRDSLPLLRALSVVDLHNTYRRLDFNEGSFRMATQAGSLRISDILIRSGDLTTLQGGFLARPPTTPELDTMMAAMSQNDGSSGEITEENDEFTLDFEELERQFTLRQAARAARRNQDGETADEDGRIFDRIEVNYESRMLAEQQAARLARTLIYEGELVISLPANAFDRTAALRQAYPINPETNRIPVPIPITGPLHTITREQTDQIFELGRQ